MKEMLVGAVGPKTLPAEFQGVRNSYCPEMFVKACKKNGGAVGASVSRKNSQPLVCGGGNDALVHQQLDLDPAIFASPGRSLVGGCGVGLTHCARGGNATNRNATILKQIGDHCLGAFLAQHLIAGSGPYRVGKARHLDHVALLVGEGLL